MAYRGGFTYSAALVVGNTMADPGRTLDIKEQFQAGVGKAHRGVMFSHHDYRNFNRGAGLPKGNIDDVTE